MKSALYKILICCLFILPLSAQEIPPVYAPFKPFLGTWIGKSKIVIKSEKEELEMTYNHTSHYVYDAEQLAVIWTCTDTNTITGRTTRTYYTIIWDSPSKTFKMLGVVRGSGARFYHLTVRDGGILEDYIDKPQGTTFESIRKINKHGIMQEVGKHTIPKEAKTYEWNNSFTKK